jgi:hypothetical protein
LRLRGAAVLRRNNRGNEIVGAYQNVIGSVPIANVEKPPEGTKGSALTYTMTPTDYVRYENFSLWADFALSQVMSLVIDNTQSNISVQVTAGPLGQIIVVPANTGMIVPTFCSQSTFSMIVELIAAPMTDQTVVISLLNYDRAAATWGSDITKIPVSRASLSNYNAAVSLNPLLPDLLIPSNPNRRDFAIGWSSGAGTGLFIHCDVVGPTQTIFALITDSTARYITGSQIFANVSYTGNVYISASAAAVAWGSEF